MSLAGIGFRILREGGVWLGAEGLDPQDVLQYLAWARDSGEHLAAGAKYSLAPSQGVLVEPVFLVSGLLHEIGLNLGVAYLIWKPIAVVTVFGGLAAYARRLLPADGSARLSAIALGVFFYAPLLVMADDVDLASSSVITSAAFAATAHAWRGCWSEGLLQRASPIGSGCPTFAIACLCSQHGPRSCGLGADHDPSRGGRARPRVGCRSSR